MAVANRRTPGNSHTANAQTKTTRNMTDRHNKTPEEHKAGQTGPGHKRVGSRCAVNLVKAYELTSK